MLNGNVVNCYDGYLSFEDLKTASYKNELTCPACGGVYEYCHGAIVPPYFRHKAKDDCNNYSEPETEEHVAGKKNIYEWIRKQDGVTDAILEAWIPETRQRPDIMFKYNNKQYVIEYQCSPIVDEYVHRHDLYKSAGIRDIWILGVQKYLNYTNTGSTYRIREIEKHNKMHYDPNVNLFMLMFSSSANAYPLVPIVDTFEEAIEYAKSFGYGAFQDKSKIICMFPEYIMFNKSFSASDIGRRKYSRTLERMMEIVNESFDKINSAFKRIGVLNDIYWKDTKITQAKQEGKFMGSLHQNNSGYILIELMYEFKYGVPTWSIYIQKDYIKWSSNKMITKMLLVYLSGNFPTIVKQLFKSNEIHKIIRG